MESLHERGRHAEPCGPELGCDWEDCQGWQMMYPEDLLNSLLDQTRKIKQTLASIAEEAT